MKMYGVVGAMSVEVEFLRRRMKVERVSRVASMEFYVGQLAGKDVVIVAGCGGKVNATVAVQILIDRWQVSALVFTGVAGAISPTLAVGDIVIATDTVQHDVDVTAFGYELGAIPDWHVTAFDTDSTLREVAKRVAVASCPDVTVVEGRIATGDQFIHTPSIKRTIADTFGAVAVDMESAAVGQVAWLNHVPYIVIRAISDKADGEAQVVFDQFLSVVARRAASIVEGIISSDVGSDEIFNVACL